VLIVPIWQFLKSRLHHWPELQRTFLNPKINHPALGVQHDGAEGHHGCEVPSEDSKALGSPLPVPLRVIPHGSLYPNFLYRNYFVFLPYFVTSVCFFSMK